MTNEHDEEMRAAFPGVEVEQHQGDYIRRIVLPNARLVNDLDTRYEAALREAREAIALCKKKAFKWHPCSNEVVAMDKALTTINEILGEK